MKNDYTIIGWPESQEFIELETSGDMDFLNNAEAINAEDCEILGCGSIAYRINTEWLEKYYSNKKD